MLRPSRPNANLISGVEQLPKLAALEAALFVLLLDLEPCPAVATLFAAELVAAIDVAMFTFVTAAEETAPLPLLLPFLDLWFLSDEPLLFEEDALVAAAAAEVAAATEVAALTLVATAEETAAEEAAGAAAQERAGAPRVPDASATTVRAVRNDLENIVSGRVVLIMQNYLKKGSKCNEGGAG